MDGGAWWAVVHGVAEGRTTEWLHFHFSLSRIGERNGNPLQCSCLENPRDGGAWWAAVYGVAHSRTRLKRLSSSSSSIMSYIYVYIFISVWKWSQAFLQSDFVSWDFILSFHCCCQFCAEHWSLCMKMFISFDYQKTDIPYLPLSRIWIDSDALLKTHTFTLWFL